MSRFIILLFCFLSFTAVAQLPADTSLTARPDSLVQADTTLTTDTVIAATPPADSVSRKPQSDSAWLTNGDVIQNQARLTWLILQHHPYFDFKTKAVAPPLSDKRLVQGKELLFYLLVFLLIVFAVLRQLFPKYFSDLFRLFFRTTLKQRQIRDQLMQTPLPSLMLNGFFVISAGLYISFMLQHFAVSPASDFWIIFFYACIGLSLIYLVKFIGLKISGWLFSMSEAAESYLFIVFISNKMMGMLLLPFLVLLAFSRADVYHTGLTLSWCLLGGIFIYRLILSFGIIRNQVRVNLFHFLLYLAAFEVAPLLLVYKALLLYFG